MQIFFLWQLAELLKVIQLGYSHNTKTDLAAVKQVLEQPDMTMSPGKHYRYGLSHKT